MSDSVKVLVVDDQELVRSGYRLVCSGADSITIVGEAVDGETAIAAVGEHQPDVVIMDIRMPGMDGIDATEAIVQRFGTTAPRIVVITTFDDEDYIYRALRAGATSFLLKDSTPEEIIHAVQLAAADGSVLAPSITRMLIDRHLRAKPHQPPDPRIENLTVREREVMAQVCLALSNAEIGRRLFVSERTVKGHLTSLMAKLELRSRVEVVVYAYEHGLVEDS